MEFANDRSGWMEWSILTTTPAETVSLVVALAKAGGTLRCNPVSVCNVYRTGRRKGPGIGVDGGIADLHVLILDYGTIKTTDKKVRMTSLT